jgi:hypothetical protein
MITTTEDYWETLNQSDNRAVKATGNGCNDSTGDPREPQLLTPQTLAGIPAVAFVAELFSVRRMWT